MATVRERSARRQGRLGACAASPCRSARQGLRAEGRRCCVVIPRPKRSRVPRRAQLTAEWVNRRVWTRFQAPPEAAAAGGERALAADLA
jgi:hypothetical protein